MRQGILAQLRHLATSLLNHVILGTLALGHTAVGYIGHAQQDVVDLVLSGAQVVVNLLVSGLEGCYLGLDVLGLVTVALLHEGTDLGGHFIEHSSIVVALLLQGTALLVQFHNAHNGFTPVKLLDGEAANDVLGVLVNKL